MTSQHISLVSETKFSNVDTNTVMKKLRKVNIKKTTGYGGLSTKLTKIASPKSVTSLTCMINRCINDCVFPESLKMANISPVFKTKDEFKKKNYRPISVLCVFSKIFENVLNDQLQKYFDTTFSILLSASRKM